MTRNDSYRSGAHARGHTAAQWYASGRLGRLSIALGVPCILLGALLFLGASSSVAKADPITSAYGTGTPVMSWAYYSLHNVVPPVPYWEYYPFRPDYDNAAFQGYVSTPADGIWGPIYSPGDQNSIFVFRTSVVSSVDQIVSLNFGGDDQGVAYVNGTLQDYSHIFTRGGHFELSLTAGVPVFLEIAIYNGPDGWVLGLNRPDGQSLLGTDGTIIISAAPEPASLWLAVVGLAGLAGARRKGPRARRRNTIGV